MTIQSGTAINIDGIHIRQDSADRYNLNDLHKTSGGENRHRPSIWLDNQQTINLVAEIIKTQETSKAEIPALEQNQPLKVLHGGSTPGTYVVIELVYAYAMWISPAFHLKVIRAYHAMMTNTHSNTIPQNSPIPLCALVEAAKISAEADQATAESARISAEASRNLYNTILALADQYGKSIPVATTTITPQPLQPVPTETINREKAFLHAWWDCVGSKTVTASDLYRAIATQQCQELNNSSSSLLGDIEQWTPKKLSHALRRWSTSSLDGYVIINMGKSSRGMLWRLENITVT